MLGPQPGSWRIRLTELNATVGGVYKFRQAAWSRGPSPRHCPLEARSRSPGRVTARSLPVSPRAGPLQ